MKSLDHYQFLFWSSLLSFLSLLILTYKAKQLQFLKKQTSSLWLRTVMLGFLGSFFYYFCLYQGYLFGSKVEVLSVQYTWPAWIIVFTLIVSKQKFVWQHGFVIASGLACVLLVISKGNLTTLSVPNPAVLAWVLLGAMGFALFSVLSKQTKMPALPLNTIFFAVATIGSFILMMVKSTFEWPQANNILALLTNGILVNGVSYYFWVTALRQTKTEYLSLLTFLTPLISVIYLIGFFNERFYNAYYIAFGLVAISGFVSVIRNLKVKNLKAAI